MADENEKRINIDDIAKPEEELTDEEAKGVTGGGILYAALHNNDAPINRVNLTSGNTVGGSLSNDPSNPSRKMGDGSV